MGPSLAKHANPQPATRLAALAFVLVALILLGGCKAKIAPELGAQNAGKPVRPQVVQADPAWFGCKADTDCQVEKGLCDSPQAVNKAFLSLFQIYRDHMNQQVDCTVFAPVVVNAKAQCVKQRCAIQKPAKSKAQ